MKNLLAIISLSLLCLPGTSTAQVASSSIHVDAKPTGLTIRIDNMQVTHNTLATRGDRIYIDVPAIHTEQQIRLSEDKTIKMVEMASGRHPRISVQLRHGRQKTEAIGMASTIENIGGDVVLHIPRWPLPAETPAPASVAVEEAVATEPVVLAAEPEVKETPEADSDDLGAVLANAKETEEAAVVSPAGAEGGTSMGLIAGLFLIMAGAAIVYWRSRRITQEDTDLENLRVVATKQLGGKAKVVWLNVGARNMLVSVGESGTQLLSEWGTSEEKNRGMNNPPSQDPASSSSRGRRQKASELPWQNMGLKSAQTISPTLLGVPEDELLAGGKIRSTGTLPGTNGMKKPSAAEVYDFRKAFRVARKAQERMKPEPVATSESTGLSLQSPALAGLLKLRDEAPAVNEDVATTDADADAEWARELFRATREPMFGLVD